MGVHYSGRTCFNGGQILSKDMSFSMTCHTEYMSYGRSCFV